jgi:hypothetical protein
VVKLRGLDVVRFPHFGNKLARKTAEKVDEIADGALAIA